MCAYVIGVQQMGGCWLWNERCYETMEAAERELKRLYDRDEEYAKKHDVPVSHGGVKIFTLFAEKGECAV